MTQNFAVGQAPWETGAQASTNFPVGKAPWETASSPAQVVSPTINQSAPLPVSAGQDFNNQLGEGLFGKDNTDAKGFIPSLVQNTVGSRGIGGVAQLPSRVGAALTEYGLFGKHQAQDLYQTAQENSDKAAALLKQAQTEKDPVQQAKMKDLAVSLLQSAKETVDSADKIKQQTDTTGGQALGTTLNAELTALTGAKPNFLGDLSPALKPLAAGTLDINLASKAIRIGGRVAENSLVGVGYNTASNLENKQTITEGDTTAAILGGSLPILGEGLSAAKGAAQKASSATAESIMGALIKPLDNTFSYGKNPVRGVLNEGITANSVDELGQKVVAARNKIGQRIGEIGDELTNPTSKTPTASGTNSASDIQKTQVPTGKGTQGLSLGSQGGITLDLNPALKPLDEAMGRAARLNNQTLVNSLYDVKVALTHDLGLVTDTESGRPIIKTGVEKDLGTLDYNGAVKFLSDISEHTRFSGNPSDDKALNTATKQAYGTAREIMNAKATEANPKLGAELKDLNSRYADLSSAKLAINHRELALKRANYISLAGRINMGTATAGALATAMITGNWAEAGAVFLGSLGAGVGGKIANSPVVITRIAKFLNGLGPAEREGIIKSTPVLKNYWDRFFHGGGTPDYGVQDTGVRNVKVGQGTGEREVPIQKPAKLALPVGSIKLPSEGVLKGQANIK